jgi:hypothetical protein
MQGSTVESAFKGAFEEIARRRDVSSRSWDETTYFPGTNINLPFHLPEQHVALVSMGTKVLAPVPLDPTRPALRVYGAFASHEEAREHAEIIQSLDDTCSLMIVALHEWVLMPCNVGCLSPEENTRRRKELLRAHEEARIQETKRFDGRVERKDDSDEAIVTPHEPVDDEETVEAEALVYKPPRKLRVGGEVRGQNYVALSVIPNKDTGECLIQIFGCLDTSQDADEWSQGIASRYVTDHDIHVGRTCDWFFPNGEMKSVSKTSYRNDELQRIMDAAERNPKAVRDYKTWKAEQDRKLLEEENTLE